MNKNKLSNLNKLMIEKNITQIVLSMEIGVSQETISAYLNGKAKPSVSTLLKIADYFNTTTDYILDRTSINFKTDEVKPLNMSDDEFNLVHDYKKLSSQNKAKIKGYIEGLLEK